MRRWIGRGLLLIGVIHTVFGVVFLAGSDLVAPILREGVFNTVGDSAPPLRQIAFWYFFFGFLLMLVGGLVDLVERHDISFPAFLRRSLLAIGIVGCILMPASGFWLVFVPVAGLFLRNRPAVVATRTEDG
jgi:hypothetical protein